MIGILVLSHGDFAKGAINALEVVSGKQDKISALGLEHEDSVGEFERHVLEKLQDLDSKEGVLVLVDMLGGTPCNVVAKLIKDHTFECIVGFNLPMLIQACFEREGSTLPDLVKNLLEESKEGMMHLNALFEQI